MLILGENDILKFIDIVKQLCVLFIIYVDFEIYVKLIYICDFDLNLFYICNLFIFEFCGYVYYIVFIDKRYFKLLVVYCGDNIVEMFLSNLLEEEDRILYILCRIELMYMMIDDENLFEVIIYCYFCGLKF